MTSLYIDSQPYYNVITPKLCRVFKNDLKAQIVTSSTKNFKTEDLFNNSMKYLIHIEEELLELYENLQKFKFNK